MDLLKDSIPVDEVESLRDNPLYDWARRGSQRAKAARGPVLGEPHLTQITPWIPLRNNKAESTPWMPSSSVPVALNQWKPAKEDLEALVRQLGGEIIWKPEDGKVQSPVAAPCDGTQEAPIVGQFYREVYRDGRPPREWFCTKVSYYDEFPGEPHPDGWRVHLTAVSGDMQCTIPRAHWGLYSTWERIPTPKQCTPQEAPQLTWSTESPLRSGTESPLGYCTESPLRSGTESPLGYCTESPLRSGTESPLGSGPLGYCTESPLGSGTEP